MVYKRTSLIIGTSVLMITLSLLTIAQIVSNEALAKVKHNDHGKKGHHSHHNWRHHWKFNDCRFNHWNLITGNLITDKSQVVVQTRKSYVSKSPITLFLNVNSIFVSWN